MIIHTQRYKISGVLFQAYYEDVKKYGRWGYFVNAYLPK